jgi:hypothetical protein
MGLPCLPYDKHQAVRDTIQEKKFDMAKYEARSILFHAMLTWPLHVEGFFEKWEFTIEGY